MLAAAPMRCSCLFLSHTRRFCRWSAAEHDREGLTRAEKVETLVQKRQRGLAVVLEHCYDQHNAAAVMRNCDAFGVVELLLVKPEGSFDPFSSAFSQTSSSSSKWVKIEVLESTTDCARMLADRGYLNIATLCSSSSQPLFHAPELRAPKVRGPCTAADSA